MSTLHDLLHTAGVFNDWNVDEFYFFTEAKPLSGKRVVRKAGDGTWKSGTGATGIIDGCKTVGYKTTLTFAYIQKGNKTKKTIWNMHEYRLPHQSGKRKGVLVNLLVVLVLDIFCHSDNLVLSKVYKRRVSGITYDALDEENTSISCIANNEADVTIGSCSSRQSPTIVSNGSEQMLSDVSSTECVEIEDVDPLKWVEGILMAEEIGNDPRMFPEELNGLEEEFRIISGL
ncbi:hypothetical protein MRB53_004879 [Persea americana]|uniref:Uncharacterized protein n=1 Tax=Persea americana TaxID=3435 RepID=A0ACC2MCM1_PERAE|nr:hypothetical protein MRB53_004879 [Persea americana]